jgi:18S rRNA (adenine1779-N6/adenine1780-N6)-dimethyltransferase
MRSARLGQHFLKNEEAIRRLVGSVPLPPKKVLEIGTGDGRLTGHLVEACYEVTSYEIDGRLHAQARKRLGDAGNLRLLLGDGFEDENEYDVLVSSLPYYASRRFVEWFSAVTTPLGIVILQKDFSDKILCEPGGRKYGAYSVLTSYCFATKELFVVPPHDFEPMPRVYSSVLQMQRLRSLSDAKLTALRLKALFSYRGRLMASFVRDMRKRRLWNDSVDVGEDLLRRRVEDLAPLEAMAVIGGSMKT